MSKSSPIGLKTDINEQLLLSKRVIRELEQQLAEKDFRIKKLKCDVKFMTIARDVCCRLTVEKDEQLKQLARLLVDIDNNADMADMEIGENPEPVELARRILGG